MRELSITDLEKVSGGDTIIVKGKKRTRPWTTSFGPDAIDFGSQITDDLQNQAKDFLGDGGGGGSAESDSNEPDPNDLDAEHSEVELEGANEATYDTPEEVAKAAAAALTENGSSSEVGANIYYDPSTGKYGFTTGYTKGDSRQVGVQDNYLPSGTSFVGAIHTHPGWASMIGKPVSYGDWDNDRNFPGEIYVVDNQGGLYSIESASKLLDSYHRPID